MKRSIHTAKRMPPDAGVTLIELLVSVAIIGIALTGVFTAFLAQNRLYRSLGDGREAQESARMGMSTVERYLSRAGWGMGPEFAIDLYWAGCVDPAACPRDNMAAATAFPDPQPLAGTDQLIFHSRNLHYMALPEEDPTGTVPETLGNAWNVTGADANSVTLEGHASGGASVIPGGQILLVTCPGAFTYAYVTVAGKTTIAEGGTQAVAVDNSDADNPFMRGADLTAPCFTSGAARAFAIDRYRFFVGLDAVSARPFLFLDRGLDRDGDGAVDPPQPVAQDVEDLQVAYIMRNGSEFGSTVGTAGQAAQPAFGPLSSQCSDELTVDYYRSVAMAPCGNRATQRQETHPANITQIRVSLTARTPAAIRTQQNELVLDPAHHPGSFSAENRDRSGETHDGHARVRLTNTIRIPNMDGRGIPFI